MSTTIVTQRTEINQYTRRGPVEDRAQFEVDGLEAAEGVLNAREALVGAHRVGGAQALLGQVGIGASVWRMCHSR